MVVKYHSGLLMNIQIEVVFLEIYSIGATYSFVFKIKKIFKWEKKWDFGFVNSPQ